MRTPEELVTVVAVLACALRVRGAARDTRQVYEAGAEPDLSWYAAEPLAYEPNLLSQRRADVRVTGPQPYFRLQQIFADPVFAATSPPAPGRMRISGELLTFGQQDPDPRLRQAIPILIVRQLPVDAYLDGSQPPPPPPPPGSTRVAKSGGALTSGLLTFGAPPPPSTTPLPWWRSPPPVPVAVRPRLTESAAETLAVGSSPLVARLHGPVAMGSGGVGYARLADGRLAIGSGSIGFAQFDVISLGSFA